MSIHELFLTLSLFFGANNLVLSEPNKTTTNIVQPNDTIKSTVPKRIASLEEFLKQGQPNYTLSLEVIYTIPKLFSYNNLGFDPAQVRNNYKKFIDIFLKQLLEDQRITSYSILLKNHFAAFNS